MLSCCALLLTLAMQTPPPDEAPLPPALPPAPQAQDSTPPPDAAPILSAPPMEGALLVRPNGAPAQQQPRPEPPWRPWWTLGVSEKAYRMVLPNGPDTGTLGEAETARFWTVYADQRQESLTLDAAELGLLAVPAVLLLGGALVVPFLGLPGLAERFKLTGSTSDNLVRTAFVITPVVSLAVIALAGLCGLGFTALSTLDGQDNGSPPPPVKVTPAGKAALKAGSRQDVRHLALAGADILVVVPCAVLAFAAPFALPWVLGAALGQSPDVMLLAWRRALSDNGSLFGIGAVGSSLAVAVLCAGIPVVMALGYGTQAAADVFHLEENPEAAGDTRDISSFLNPFNILLGRRPADAQPAPPAP